MANKKYLDYDGFKTYHNELVSHLRDLAFDPQRMFETTTELVTPANWHIEYGRLMGIKRGLIVTVADKFWQLTDPDKFQARVTRIGETIEEKANLEPEQLGWKIVGSTTEFDINGHTLKLMK